MTARDDYDYVGDEHGWEDMCDEIDRLRAQVDEAEEKIAYLRAGCVKLDRDELIQKITSIGPERWKAGVWLDEKLAPLRAQVERDRPVIEAALDYWSLGTEQARLDVYDSIHAWGLARQAASAPVQTCERCGGKGYLPRVGAKVQGQHDPLIRCACAPDEVNERGTT